MTTTSPSDADVPAPPRRVLDRLSDAVGGTVSSVVLGAGSSLRSARIFHPRGRTFRGTVQVEGDPLLAGSVLGTPGEKEVLVRFSRGTGFAEPWPDMLGFAMRILDADGHGGFQDVLMLSSAPMVGARHVILFRIGYGETFYSSIDRLAVQGRPLVLGGRASFSGERRGLARLDELAGAIADGTLGFDLLVSTVTDVDWRRWGRLRLTDEVAAPESEHLRFSPFHTAGGVEPLGVVNAWRRLGYAGSQWGREHPVAREGHEG